MSEEKRSWLQRLKAGLARSSTRLAEGIGAIVTRRRLDDETLTQLEELLIAADMGVGIAAEIVATLRRTRFDQEITADEIKLAVAQEVTRLLEPVAKPLRLDPALKPHVILVVGVNGSGKTTTIGKLAKHYRDDDKVVVIAAGDTFRAAAVELGHDEAGYPDHGAEGLGLGVRVLPGGGVEHEQHAVRRGGVELLDDADDLLQLGHQMGLVVQPPGGVDEEDVGGRLLGLRERVIGETGGVGILRPRHHG